MAEASAQDTDDTSALLERARHGDPHSLGVLLERHRERLRRLVALRMDPRVHGRLDASDVLQETYLEAARRLADYLQQPEMPFFLWLRFLALQQLLIAHRRHLGFKMRDAGREVSLYRGSLPEASSAALAQHLLGQDTSPSEAAVRAERKVRLQEALNQMGPADREIIALRHFEQLSNAEAARVLGIQEAAASKRHVRALVKLKDILKETGDTFEGFSP
jgi:RNA polymerase sigma-70 factor (ECF subfamily)